MLPNLGASQLAVRQAVRAKLNNVSGLRRYWQVLRWAYSAFFLKAANN